MEPVKPLVAPVRPKFVLFGSSIVQYSFDQGGWGAFIANKYARKADVILRGYAGWNSRRALNILHQVFPKDNPIQPSLVIVYFGGNDATAPFLGSAHVPLDEYISNMKAIATHIQGLSSTTRVIFLSTPPVQEYQLRDLAGKNYLAVKNNILHEAYSEALIKLAKEMNIPIIDMFDTIKNNPEWWKSFYTDAIHFSSYGSAVVATAILKVLSEVNWEPNLHYDYLPVEFDWNANIPSKL